MCWQGGSYELRLGDLENQLVFPYELYDLLFEAAARALEICVLGAGGCSPSHL